MQSLIAFKRQAMVNTKIRNLAEAIRRRFGPIGGVDLELPSREPMRKPPKPRR
jgi:hypothetical protein